jgi:hypothetical protein
MGNHRSSTVLGILALGLLAGCPTVDLGDTPSDIGLCNPAGGIQYFKDKIWPEFVRPTDMAKGCTKSTGCHSEAGGNALSFKTMPIDDAFNYRQTQIYLNCGTPMASELLTKPLSGVDPHGGSDLFSPSDPPYSVFLDWFK